MFEDVLIMLSLLPENLLAKNVPMTIPAITLKAIIKGTNREERLVFIFVVFLLLVILFIQINVVYFNACTFYQIYSVFKTIFLRIYNSYYAGLDY